MPRGQGSVPALGVRGSSRGFGLRGRLLLAQLGGCSEAEGGVAMETQGLRGRLRNYITVRFPREGWAAPRGRAPQASPDSDLFPGGICPPAAGT